MDNTMNNGYYYYGNNYATPVQPYGVPYGYQPYTAQNFQVPQNANALTDEEIRTLMQDKAPSQIDLNIKQNDVLRAICTHKQNGQDRVQLLSDGSGDVWCPICGARWSQDPLDKDQVVELVHALVGTMQNAKWVGDLPIELTRELFSMIPLLEKYPDVYEYALNNFNKYYGQHPFSNAQDSSVYAQYNNLFGNNYYAYAQQPMMYAQPNAQGYQQPVQANNAQGYYYQQPAAAQQTPVQNPYVNPMQAPTYGVNPAAPNQQFVQQANNMMVNPYGQPMYQQPAAQQPMAPTYAPATTAVPAAPQGYQPAASAVDGNVKNNADGTTTTENKIDL